MRLLQRTIPIRRVLARLLAMRRWVWIVAVVLTALASSAAIRLRVDANLVALLPPHAPSVRALHALVEQTGGAGDLMVMFESPELDASLELAQEMLPKVRALPWVESARIGEDTDFFERNALLYMELDDLREAARRIDEHLDAEVQQRNPLYIDFEGADRPGLDLSDLEAKYRKHRPKKYFASDDGRVLLMVVRPAGVTSDIRFVRRVHRDLAKLVGRQDTRGLPVTLSVGGTFKNRLDEYDTLTSDIRSSVLWVSLAIAVSIALFFRSILALLVVLTPLAMGMAWTFALASVLYGSLNTVTLFLIVILIGLGIDFGIHLVSRFQRERRSGRDVVDTLAATMDTAGRAALTASLTTAASFFALVFTDFEGFSQFGVIAGTGLVAAAVAYLAVAPLLLAFVHERGLMLPRGEREPRPGRPLRGAGTIVLLAVVLSGAAVVAARSASFEYDLRNLRSRVAETRSFNRKMRTVFVRARDPAAILVADDAEARAVVDRIERRRQRDGRAAPVEAVRAAHQLLPSDVEAKLATVGRLRGRIERLVERDSDFDGERRAALMKVLRPDAIHRVEDLPASLTRPFVGKDGQRIVYVFQRGSLLDLRVARAYADWLRSIEVAGRPVRAASEPLVFADVLRVVERDAPRAIALASAVLVVVLAIDFGSLAAVAWALLPLGLGILWMVGLMGALDVELNLFNAAVLPAIVGLGIDAGVHVHHGARRLGADRMTEVIRELGPAVVASTGTSMIAFAGMLTASHPGLRSIGELALLGLGACMVAALVVLPAALTVAARWQRRSSSVRRRWRAQASLGSTMPSAPTPRRRR